MPLPARLESSKRCYWLWQTSGWNEWADTTVAAMPACFFGGALRAQNQKTKKPKNQKTKKPKNQKNKKTKKRKFPAAGRQKRFRLLRFFPAHSGQPAGEKSRLARPGDPGQRPWDRTGLPVRWPKPVFLTRSSWAPGQRGWQGDTSPCNTSGRRPQ